MTISYALNVAHTSRPHGRNPEQNDMMYDQHVTKALFFYVPNISKPAFVNALSTLIRSIWWSIAFGY